MKKILYAILWAWQMPQHLLGLFLVWMFGYESKYEHRGSVIHVCRTFPSAISLGRYIIVNKDEPVKVAHECGHSAQSRILGPLYFITIGIWSGIRSLFRLYKKGHYYDSFPEDWADRLGGVKKNEDGKRYAEDDR
jgi:hypothetical protein